MDPMPLTIGASNTALYKQIGSRLPKMTTAFLIGGENLRAKSLRDDGRHDHDFVMSNEKDFEVMVSTLTDIGFQRTTDGPQSNSRSGSNMRSREMLLHPKFGLVDVFNIIIGKNRCYLSKRMVDRAAYRRYGKLKLGLLHVNDIFLLKGVTDRQKDMQDILKIVKTKDFDWGTVWEEMKLQEKDTREYISGFLLDTIDDLITEGVPPPAFLNRLLIRVVDTEIKRYLREGEKPLEALLGILLKHSSIKKEMVMNRIEFLRKHKHLGTITRRDSIILKLRDRGSLNIYRKYGASNSYQSALSLVDTIANKAGLSEKVKQKAIEIMYQLSEHGMFGGYKPQATVAAVLCVAAEEIGQHWSFTNTDVRMAANVSPPSFYHNQRRIWLFVQVSKMSK
jgi:transcription initiation factor TFIIIB Brf1 subunit/transcription initiation factor TFIIB